MTTARMHATCPARLAARLALIVLLAAPASHAGGTFTAKVVSVLDGDTVVVREERGRRYEVRLAGIDAPEITQPYGVRSRARLVESVYGKRVTVAWYKRDRYHRVLGRVWAEARVACGAEWCLRGIDAGYVQIAAGMAWHDKQHLDEQRSDERLRYARAEQEARARHAGLWADPAPMPPWRYRHRHSREHPQREH